MDEKKEKRVLQIELDEEELDQAAGGVPPGYIGHGHSGSAAHGAHLLSLA